VVIPTCARPPLLKRALESVRAQTAPPAEMIVVDDGSDRDGDAVRRVVETSGLPAARLVGNARPKGPSGARNTGAALATRPLLAFLDDDDEWLPTYLAAAVRRFESADVDVMCTDLQYRYDDGTERPGKCAPDVLAAEAFLTRNPGLIGSNLLITGALYRRLAGFDESLLTCEDMDFGIRLSLHPGVRYAPLHERLVRHHQHSRTRLCMPRGEAMCAGVRRFFELHGPRMNAVQQAEFRSTVRRLWHVDEYGRVDAQAATLAARPS